MHFGKNLAFDHIQVAIFELKNSACYALVSFEIDLVGPLALQTVRLVTIEAHSVVDCATFLTSEVNALPFMARQVMALKFACACAGLTRTFPVKALRAFALCEQSASLVAAEATRAVFAIVLLSVLPLVKPVTPTVLKFTGQVSAGVLPR